MYRSKLNIICLICASIILPGCFGMGTLEPKECHLITPTTSNPMWSIKYNFGNWPTRPSTKQEFLKDWGEPDRITVTFDKKKFEGDSKGADITITTFESTETWIYNRHLWCGIIPAFIIPIPLILPVCDGFDELVFQGGEAIYLNTKRSRFSGCYLGGSCSSDPCWPKTH